MKAIVLSHLLGLLMCSCGSFERAGLRAPKPQVSESMKVVDAGFVLKPRSRTVVLSVEVEVQTPPSEAKYLRVNFPDLKTKVSDETKSVALDGGQYRVRSSALMGLKYLEVYPIRIQLCEDPAGEKVIEELVQNVRFEVPPAALAQMGVTL